MVHGSEAAVGAEHRIAVVVHPGLSTGEVANVVGIVVGGLTREGFGDPLRDADGHPHAVVRCDVVVLAARSGAQLLALLRSASESSVRHVTFSRFGQQSSDSFAEYAGQIPLRGTDDLGLAACIQ